MMMMMMMMMNDDDDDDSLWNVFRCLMIICNHSLCYDEDETIMCTCCICSN